MLPVIAQQFRFGAALLPRAPGARSRFPRLGFPTFCAANCSRPRAKLGDDAGFVSASGGKRPAALNPIYDADKILRFLAGIVRKTTRFTRRRFRAPRPRAWGLNPRAPARN